MSEEVKKEAAPEAQEAKKEESNLLTGDAVKGLSLIGKKLGMTQIFDEGGDVVPVTVIELSDNMVTSIKTKEKHGYDALQIGNFPAKEKHLTRAQVNHLKKNGLPLYRKLKEVRTPDAIDTKIGAKLDAAAFFEGLAKVDLTSTSIGKGFQGGVKLHHFSDGRKTHGSKSHRQIGSLGAGTDPSRVFKGKRMPSMMGNRTVTTQKVKVVEYDAEKNLLLVRGPVSGKPGAVVTIKAFGVKTWNHYNKKAKAAV